MFGKSESQDDIGAAAESGFCTQVSVHDSGNATLHEITAHHDNDGVAARAALSLFNVIAMTVVKRVVLSNDTCNLHG